MKFTSSFKVQPSNIHELNSFLNNNHYYNVQDNYTDVKKKSPPQITNLISRKNNSNSSYIDRQNEHSKSSPPTGVRIL